MTLELERIVTTIEVTETVAQLATSSPKFSEPLRDTPQTVSVIPARILAEQGATTLRDALRNVAGISLAAGEGGAQGDSLTIRGFNARNDLFLDGMRDFGSYYRDPFNIEEVQVLEGPSSVTFGRGSTGGVVNQSGKTAFGTRRIGGEADFGTDRTRRVALDLNQPLDRLRPGTAFRVNLMGHQSDVAGRDVAENRRFGVASSLAFGLGTATRWSLNYFHQTGSDIPDYGVPWLFNSPAPVNRRNYYGFANGNFLRTYDDVGTVKLEHDLGAGATIRNQARSANYLRDVQITESRVPAAVTPATPLADIVVARNQIAVASDETLLADQLDISARFATGFLRHSFVAGAEVDRETSAPVRPGWTNVPPTSLLAPLPYEPFTGRATIASRVRTTAFSVAGYALDTLKFGRKWELTGGLRWDRFDADYRQSVAPVSSFSRVDRMTSWRAGLVYKPVPHGTLYGSAGTSFNPSAESLSLSAATANLAPEKNRTCEVGTKWELHGGDLSLHGALFRTDKLNAREPDPVNPLLNVLAGSQRVNGAQFELRGRLTSRWEMLASYARLASKVVSSGYYPQAIGAQLANVPKNTASAWSTYRLPGRWRVGAGGSFVDRRTASSTVPLDPATGLIKAVPGYWVFNAMASHPLGEHAELRANVNNIANRYYYDLPHPGHVILGPGRSALLGLRFKF